MIENNESRFLGEDASRLEALYSYGILDTDPEEIFDDFTRLIGNICEAPVAVINFIDHNRQWFKSEIGLGVRETPLDISICRHAILQQDIFIVPDTTKDPRFQNNPLVSGEPHLRFYAGALLNSSEGLPLGTLCVLDYEPRQLTEEQKHALTVLARQVMTTLELRKASHALRQRLIESEALRATVERKRQRLSNILSGLGHAYIACDRELICTYANDEFISLFRCESSQVIGRPLKEIAREIGLPRVADTAEASVNANTPLNLRLQAQDTDMWCDIRTFPRDTGLSILVFDATRDRELDAAQDRLKRVAAVTQVVGGVAHEFNNMLTTVVGNADLMAESGQISGDDAVSLAAIRDAAQKGGLLVAQLMSFTASRFLEPEELDIGAFVRELENRMSARLPEGVSLDIVRPQERLIASIDRLALKEAVLHLVKNAGEASSFGQRVTVSVFPHAYHETMHMQDDLRKGGLVGIAVEDEGHGMTDDIRHRAIEPFFSTKPVGEGSGLGLSMVEGFARQSGGYFELESKPGSGTRVLLSFPRIGAH